MNRKILFVIFILATTPVWALKATPTSQPTLTPIVTLTPTLQPTPIRHLPTLRLFTDKKDCAYTHAYPPEDAKCAVILKNKKRWVDMKLSGSDKSGLYMGVEKKDLAPYVDNGALEFYIRGNKGGETLSGVGFRMEADDKHKFNYAIIVPLGDYCVVSTKWQRITIPLSEFPRTGKFIKYNEETRKIQKILNQGISNSDQELFETHFKWDQVFEIQFEHTHGNEEPTEIQITDVVIVPHYKLKTVVREKEDIQ